MKDNYTIIRKHWNGPCGQVAYEIRWNPNYVIFDDGSMMGHMEIESHDRSPLPITATGYRSHFIHACIVDENGGAESYTDAWFAFALSVPAGHAIAAAVNADRQLSLF